MKCDCITKIDDKLKDKNLRLSGLTYTFPDFYKLPVIATKWIDQSKAPRGEKKTPPAMFATYCPWCGVKIIEKGGAQ